MGIPIGIITMLPTLVRGVTELVGTVEKLVKKPGSGAEKKEMVLDAFEDQVKAEADVADDSGVYGDMLFFDGKYDWGCLITKLPALRGAVGDLIDAVVRIKNILKVCDK
jgi:hypothetical protein